MTGYLIERCLTSGCTFAQIATAPSATYFDTGVAASTSYNYRVRATNASNILSSYSNTVTASTAAAVSYQCTSGGPATVCYFYDEAGRLKAAQRDDGARQTYVLDAAGNRLASAGAPVNPATKPVLAVSPHSANSMNVSWTASSGGNGQYAYVVKRGGQTLTGITSTPALDTGLTPNTSYTYTVTATDSDGNTAQSDAASGTTYPKPVISAFNATTVSATVIRLAWTATEAGGPPGGLTYSIKRDSTTLTCTTSPCTDTGLVAGTNYTYTLTATDSAGRPSDPAPLNASTYALPVVSLSASPASASSLNLSWTASDVNGPGIQSYNLYRGSTLLTSTASTSYTDSGLAAGTSYAYTVTAYDIAGDPGSGTVTGLTYSLPVVQAIASPVNGAFAISLSWSATDSNGPGIQNYNVYRGSALLTTTPIVATSYTDSGLTGNTTYTYTVAAYDTAGDSGSGSASATTVPVAPVIDASPGGSVTSGTPVTVSWTAPPGPINHYTLNRYFDNGTIPSAFTFPVPTTSVTYSFITAAGTDKVFTSTVHACVSGDESLCSPWSNSVTYDVFKACPKSGCP